MSEDTTAAERTTVTTVSARPTIRVALPQGWARAVLSGIEAALLGWALVVVPTLIAYAAVASNQWLVSTTWEDAFHFASDLWGAALGAQVVSGEVSYRAVPLLFVLVLIGLTKLLLLQGRRFPAAAQWMAIPGFTVTALLLAGGIGTHVRILGALPLAIAIPFIARNAAVVEFGCGHRVARLVGFGRLWRTFPVDFGDPVLVADSWNSRAFAANLHG